MLHLQRTTAFGSYDDGFVLALERRTDHLGTAAPKHLSRQRVWRFRARSIVVATGAHERPVVFADNDRPGIMLAGAARTFLNRYGVLPGREAVVFTTNDSAYDAALDLHRAGVRVQAVVDARPAVPARRVDECEQAGIPVVRGSVVTGTRGVERVTHALVAPFLGGEVGTSEAIACDLLLVSGGWNPAVHLFSQARGRLRYDEALGAFVPGEELDGLAVAGAAAGVFDLAGCLADGQRVAREALTALGFEPARDDRLPAAPDSGAPAAPLVLWRVPDTSGAGGTTQFVDLQRDATVADIARAVGAGLRSIEHIKRYTTIGTAHDQGKTSGVITSGITAELLGIPVQDTGTTTFRPPYTPVAFAALAGRDRGRLFDPERVTALHDWHVAAGAVFEDVGQWKRPRYYPQPGEDMEAAVLRECAATRTGVGILDGSTLGKIDVQGPDAGVLLDLLYTNLMSSLKVGSVRYGVMCGVDGMVIDDGTVLRLAEDRFLVLTTTGGAAKILDWMEEWLQTEWPHLRVHCTSVTEQWATFPVVGPRSRDVIGAVFPDVDVSKEAFPFMAWRDTTLDGVPVRLARISFSGELAYEVYVNPWYAVAVWQRLVEAGRPYGITPYGTETMHVLRAEKGYPIIGQDTDGTVTPQDLGMAWAISKKKPDFVGQALLRPGGQPGPAAQAAGRAAAGRPADRAAGGLADRGVLRGRRAAPAAGADARPRHLQLPQRRARPPLRPGPGQGRARRASATPSTSPSTAPSSRSRSPARCWSIPKEPVAMAELLLRTHPLEAWSDAFAGLPDSVGITVEPFVAMVDVRLGRTPAASAAGGRPADGAQHLGADRRRARRLARARRVAADQHRRGAGGAGGPGPRRRRPARRLRGGRLRPADHPAADGGRGSATSSPGAARSTCTRGSSAGAGARRPRSAWPVSCCWPCPTPATTTSSSSGRRSPATWPTGCSTRRWSSPSSVTASARRRECRSAGRAQITARIARSKPRTCSRARSSARSASPAAMARSNATCSATTCMSTVDSRSRNMQWMRVARLS